MSRPVISSTGLYTPPHSISNAELVASLNAWTDNWNSEHAEEIASGALQAKQHSSVEFIEKASGIKSRYVVDKAGVLDPARFDWLIDDERYDYDLFCPPNPPIGSVDHAIGMHVSALPTASKHVNPDPVRTRKLLLKADEIKRLIGKVERAGYTLIPLNLHYQRGRIKCEVGLAKGKKQHDKRDTERERDAQREISRVMKQNRR